MKLKRDVKGAYRLREDGISWAVICEDIADELDMVAAAYLLEIDEGGDFCLENVGEALCEDFSCEDCYPDLSDPLAERYPCHSDAFRLYGPGVDEEGLLIPDLYVKAHAIFRDFSEGFELRFNLREVDRKSVV